MVSNLVMANTMAADEVESIGNGFVTKYFDALMGKPNPRTLRQLFNEQSVYIFAQHGHPDHEMYGMYLIGWFIKRMEYGKCTVTVRSVDTSTRPHPTEFKVSSVCELMRPGNDVSLNFTQSFVIRRVPWTRTEFQIVETYSKFDVEIENDYLPEVVPVPITFRKIKIEEPHHNLSSPVNKFTGIDEKLEKSNLKRKDEIHSSKEAYSKKICKTSQAASTNRDGEIKYAGKRSTVCSMLSNSKNVWKTSDQKSNNILRVNSKSNGVKPTHNNAVVSKKIAVSQVTEMQSAKKSPKGVFNITVSTVKQNNFKSKMPAIVDKKTFISANRFESLAVDDENDDNDSIIADRSVNPSSPSKDTPEGINSLTKISKCTAKSQKSPAIILIPDEQRTATKISQQNNNSTTSITGKSKKRGKKSATVQSVQIDSSAKCDESTARKAEIKMFDTVNEGSKGSDSKYISAPLSTTDLDAQAPDGTPTVTGNGRSKRSRKNRKKHNKNSNYVAPSYIRRVQ